MVIRQQKPVKDILRRVVPIVLVSSLLALPSFAAESDADGAMRPDELALLQKLRDGWPNTQFKSVKELAMFPGVFEVEMGKNIAYVDATSRYWLFGHVYDMERREDLTAAKLPGEPAVAPDSDEQAAPRVSFEQLPLEDAIKTVKGSGSRHVAIFSDPDCPYCKKLESVLKGVTDVTIYTFLMPLDSLHPQARSKAAGVWCAKDRAAAWERLMSDGVAPQGECSTPIERNLALAETLKIRGTPTLILSNGDLVRGAVSKGRLEQLLAAAEGADK